MRFLCARVHNMRVYICCHAVCTCHVSLHWQKSRVCTGLTVDFYSLLTPFKALFRCRRRRGVLVFWSFPSLWLAISSDINSVSSEEPLERLRPIFIVSVVDDNRHECWDEADTGICHSPFRWFSRSGDSKEGPAEAGDCTREELPEENTDFKNWTSYEYRFYDKQSQRQHIEQETHDTC